jgi:hypothetical protein
MTQASVRFQPAVFAGMAEVRTEAVAPGSYIPASPILLPDGPWKQVCFCYLGFRVLQSKSRLLSWVHNDQDPGNKYVLLFRV